MILIICVEIININIHTKFHDNQTKNVTSIALTKFTLGLGLGKKARKNNPIRNSLGYAQLGLVTNTPVNFQ